MDIITQHDVEEEVYYFYNNSIHHGKICNIEIIADVNPDNKLKVRKRIWYGVVSDNSKYGIPNRVESNNVFKSKEEVAKFAMELLEKLNKLD